MDIIHEIKDNDIHFINDYVAKDDIESETGFFLIDKDGDYVSNGAGWCYAWSLEEIFGYINEIVTKED